MHDDAIVPHVLCKKCGSQDTRKTDPAWLTRLERGDGNMSEFCAREIAAQVHELMIYRRAMESMAAQFVHPKITAMEMALQQLGESA